MENVICVKNLTKFYGQNKALDNLNLAVKKGEILGLLGHNGAGKSTAIECILSIKQADTGIAEILGKEPKYAKKQLFERVGVQFQQTNVQEKIKVSELCELTASFYKNPADRKGLLKTFGLTKKENAYVAELSGGERQRLFVILALIPNPEVVFLDELTTGLDTKARRDVWTYLEMLKKEGLTILMTSHYMDEVNVLCDTILILKKGTTVFTGTIEEAIKNSPCDNLEDAYLWYSGEEENEDENG